MTTHDSHLCPNCGQALPADDINENTHIAFCRICNLSIPLSTAKPSHTLAQTAALDTPPSGAWYHDDGHIKRIGASCRSATNAVLTGLEALLWNAAVLLLVGLATVSTLTSFGMRMPDWIPVQVLEIGAKSGGCVVVIMWLFALPFAWWGLGKMWDFLLRCGGQVEVVIADAVGGVTTSVFGLGRRKPFNPSRVKSVSIEQEMYTRKRKRYYRPIIVLEPEEGAAIRFGLQLGEDRQAFVVAALNRVLRRDQVARVPRR